MFAECKLPTPKEIHAVQDLSCQFKISVAVTAEQVFGLLHETVGGITHVGLRTWTAAGRAGAVIWVCGFKIYCCCCLLLVAWLLFLRQALQWPLNDLLALSRGWSWHEGSLVGSWVLSRAWVPISLKSGHTLTAQYSSNGGHLLCDLQKWCGEWIDKTRHLDFRPP
jgi:hypothetical protein